MRTNVRARRRCSSACSWAKTDAAEPAALISAGTAEAPTTSRAAHRCRAKLVRGRRTVAFELRRDVGVQPRGASGRQGVEDRLLHEGVHEASAAGLTLDQPVLGSLVVRFEGLVEGKPGCSRGGPEVELSADDGSGSEEGVDRWRETMQATADHVADPCWDRGVRGVGHVGLGVDDQSGQLPDEERVASRPLVEQGHEAAAGLGVVVGAEEVVGQQGDVRRVQACQSHLLDDVLAGHGGERGVQALGPVDG